MNLVIFSDFQKLLCVASLLKLKLQHGGVPVLSEHPVYSPLTALSQGASFQDGRFSFRRKSLQNVALGKEMGMCSEERV